MSTSNALQMLTPGATFRAENGREVKFLMFTNMSLPAKLQLKYPPQIIYVDEDSNVFNRPVDSFLSQYKFYNVDPELEQRLEALFVFDEEDGADDEYEELVGTPNTSKPAADLVSKSLQVTASTAATATSRGDDLLLPDDEEDEEHEELETAETINSIVSEFRTLHSQESGVPLAVNPSKLSQNLVRYWQEPDIDRNLILHKLVFAVDDVLTQSVIEDLFRPNAADVDINSQRRTMDLFGLLINGKVLEVMWTAYVGVFPYVDMGGSYAMVILGTDEVLLSASDEEVEEIPDSADIVDIVDEKFTDSPLVEPTTEVGSIQLQGPVTEVTVGNSGSLAFATPLAEDTILKASYTLPNATDDSPSGDVGTFGAHSAANASTVVHAPPQ